jgi:magnesium transporter
MEPFKLAPIINEMQMDEAVDLLDACDAQKRQSVYAMLPAENVIELKELSQLSAYSVGSIMNTDFITAKPNEKVSTVLERIRVECEKCEVYRYAYILDDDGRLKGVVSLRNLLMSNKKMLIADIMAEQPVSVQIDTRIRSVAKFFFKYNFEAIPVVDEDDTLQGLVSYRDAVASLYPEIKEEDTV